MIECTLACKQWKGNHIQQEFYVMPRVGDYISIPRVYDGTTLKPTVAGLYYVDQVHHVLETSRITETWLLLKRTP